MMTQSPIDIRRSFGAGIGGATFGDDTAEYLFGRIKRLRLKFQIEHPDITVLNFGIGEPYNGPDHIVREAAVTAIRDSRFDGYPDLGLAKLREAAASHFQTVFGLSYQLDPETHVQDCWGIKPSLDALTKVFCSPGNQEWPVARIQVAVTTPGYPVFGTQAAKLGAQVITMPVTRENGYLPDISVLEKAAHLHAIYLISPHNPTGRAYDTEAGWWQKVVDFCRERSVALIVDEAYCHLRWAPGKPFTALSIPGFMDVGVVLHSVSKTLDWTSGRIGWVVGNPMIIRAYRKEYEDSSSGQTLALQWAAAEALNNFGLIVPKIQADYRRRLEGLIKILQSRGFPVQMPDGGFFIFSPAPTYCGGQTIADAEEFMQYLLNEHGIVSVPFGDHIRFASTVKVGGPGQPATYERALEMLNERLPEVFQFKS
ncbi:MAG: aminotransferase class I/II-fold pyridoxal phosphate-dependent enzyme [Patescibacteria group bacterium]|jgi:LL-diaminopimelate aminotransferase